MTRNIADHTNVNSLPKIIHLLNHFYLSGPRLFIAFSLILFMTIFSAIQLTARHIVGGDMIYDCVGSSDDEFTVDITLNIYRDAFQGGRGDPSGYDTNLVLGIFRGAPGSWRLVESIEVQLDPSLVRVIPVPVNPCFRDPGNVITDQAVYSTQITLDKITENYFISYQRCCRNNSVSNIPNSGRTGAVISVEITPESQAACNNSPDWNDQPDILICNGFPVELDFSVTDADTSTLTSKRDSISYKFCSPISVGGTRGSPDNPCPPSNPTCGGDCDGVVPSPERCSPDDYGIVRFLTSMNEPIPGLTLDEATGIITGTPSRNGLFVLAVCVEEWRDGILIGEIRRDFQFTVTICPPVQSLPNVEGRVIDLDSLAADCQQGKISDSNSCGATLIQMENLTLADEDVVSYQWSFVISAGDTIRVTDEWEPEIEFPGIGVYWSELIINPNTICETSCVTIIDVTPEFEAKFDVVGGDVCVEAPFRFDASESTLPNDAFNFTWNWGDGNSSSGIFNVDRSISRPNYQYTQAGRREVELLISNQECRDSFVQEVEYFPLPTNLIIEPTQFLGCQPATITFDNLSMPLDDGYVVEWDFGDGGEADEISPTHVFEDEGTFDVTIRIMSPSGCESERTFNNYIRVLDAPDAQFDFSPTLVERLDQPVVFSNQSEGGQSFQWDFGDGNRSSEVSPRHIYTEVGQYEVSLVVFQDNGSCTDTLKQLVDVFPPIDPIFPNAFTPNGDGENDEFFAISEIEGFGEYELTVWSRWGEKVFESEILDEGWNGRKHNAGELLPGGVYVYLARYFNVRGEKDLIRGTVLLLE